MKPDQTLTKLSCVHFHDQANVYIIQSIIVGKDSSFSYGNGWICFEVVLIRVGTKHASFSTLLCLTNFDNRFYTLNLRPAETRANKSPSLSLSLSLSLLPSLSAIRMFITFTAQYLVTLTICLPGILYAVSRVCFFLIYFVCLFLFPLFIYLFSLLCKFDREPQNC